MKAFILAGGFATRLWPLTEARAKPLLPLAGKPILTHLVENVPKGIPITVSTNASFGPAFEEWKRELGRSDIEVLIEETRSDDQKLGALGAVKQWIDTEKIADDVLLLTGDNYLGCSMEKFLLTYRPGTPIVAGHDIQDLEKAKAFGTIIMKPGSNQIAAFEEKPKEPKTTLVSTGCSILPASTLPILSQYATHHPDNVGGIFEELLRQNIAIDCFVFTEPWLDIGSFQSYIDAHRLIVNGKLLKGEGAKVDNSTCEGSNVIGGNSVIERSSLTDCMIFENCRISDCVLRNCIIDDGCDLEGIDLSNKMLRAGSQLRAGKARK